MLYLVIFLVILFGLNLALLFFKFRESEGKLKVTLKSTEDKLRETEMTVQHLRQADTLHTKEVSQAHSFTAILDSLDAGIVVIGRDEMIQYMNGYARRQLGKSDTDNIRESYKSLPIISVRMGSVSEALSEALNGRTRVMDTDVTYKVNGKTIPVVVRFSPLRDQGGAITAVSLFYYDISATIDLKGQLQSSFSSFAHELRTPVAIVRTGVALVLENYEAMGPDKIKTTLKSVYDGVNQLSEQINEALNASRIEQGRVSVNKEKFDLLELTKNIVTSMTPLARDKKLYLTYEPTAAEKHLVEADKIKTQEILTNLISNAIKYTFQGGITVTHEQEDGHVATFISDTGVGIGADQKTLLFKKFQQVTGVSRQMSSSKSSGLGLFITKQLAVAMGGDVTLVKSEPNQGSTFKFVLPVVDR